MGSRRDFVQKMAMAALGSPLLYQGKNPKPLTPLSFVGRLLRVAIMGLGSYGTRVAKAMQTCTRAKLVGVVSGTPSKIVKWRKTYGIPEKNCYNYENFDALKDNPDIDAVYVITPNSLHHSQVIRVAKAGKHAICEKPMAISVKEGEEMVRVCKDAGVKLLVGYRMHFEPHTLKVIHMRKAGEFGKIMFFQGQSGFKIGDPNQWRLNYELAGGGAMMDIGIYAVNGSRYMVGEEPIWVTAQETKTDPVKFKKGIDETIQFQFGFPSGAVASCLSTYAFSHNDRFYLNGVDGFAEMQPSTGYGPIKGRTHKGPLDQPIVTHQTLQMDEMAGIILDGNTAEVPVDGEEGVKDLRIIEAIYKAVRKGKKVRL